MDNLTNKFSAESTKESMNRAKQNLILYLESVEKSYIGPSSNAMKACLESYLDNFYMFLEAFRENEPDKRAFLTSELLQGIHIENEYDLQHLLYAALKPLFPDIRKEVSADTGVGTVRGDLKIPSLNIIIEAKCTRKTMSYKRLTEEIEADIVHYKADAVYFLVYDKEKIIKDRHSFKSYFTKSFDGKAVNLFIEQPVNL